MKNQDKQSFDPVGVAVTIVSERHAAIAGGVSTATIGTQTIALLEKFLAPEQARALYAAEPEILAWLRARPEHAADFVKDPIDALARSGLVDNATASALRSARRPAVPADPAGTTTIRSIEVK